MKAVHALALLVGVHAGSIAPAADKYCELVSQIAQPGDLHETQMGSIFGNFSALFADKVDCSEDPHDPLIGYSLKGVTMLDCQVAKKRTWPGLQMVVAHCFRKVVDESARSAALFLETGYTNDKNGKLYKVRMAVHLAFNEDSKATSYDIIYDSYNVLDGGKVLDNGGFPTPPVALSALSNGRTANRAAFVMALIGILSLMAAIFIKRQDLKKNNTLLSAC
jgi:hypothetical protein